jgi:predicted nucleotidyltransferase component of viral defense system
MIRKFDQALHRRYLTALLSGVARAFGEKVAFKGGTCALFFYKLPRFSFDLDFDMVKPFAADDIAALRSLLMREGRVLDWQDKHYTLLGVLDYGAGHPNIKVEINKRVWKANVYKTVWFLGSPLVIANERTLLTNKLVALTDRKTPVARDLYDTWYFLQTGFEIDPALVKERTGQELKVYLKETIKFIKKTFTTRNVLQGLGNALDDEQKVWAREHLIGDTLKNLQQRLID